MVYYCSNSL